MSLWLVASKNIFADLPKIMPLGDSITSGWNQPSYRLPLARALTAHGCEVDFVGKQSLTSRTPENPRRYPGFHFPTFSQATHPGYSPGEHWDPAAGDDTDHAGYPGATSPVLLKLAWVEVRAAQPDYILLHIGTNDILDSERGRTREQWSQLAIKTVGKINEIAMAVFSSHKHPEKVKLLLANLIPAKPRENDKKWLDELQMSKTLSRYIAALVEGKKDSRITLVDVAAGFDPESMTTDGVHPNALGEKHIASAFLEALLDVGLCKK